MTALAGTDIVGAFAGSTVSVRGTAGARIVGVGASGGNLFIDPRSADVTIFGGAGSTTLLGTSNNVGIRHGRGGAGSFAGGAGLNLFVGSTIPGASTLVGGGTQDLLYAQSAGTVLKGAIGTQLMTGAGVTFPGIATIGAAQGGEVFSAGNAVAAQDLRGALRRQHDHLRGRLGDGGRQSRRARPTGDLYIDGHARGSITIIDFVPFVDRFSMYGATAISFAPIGTDTTVTLSDHTRVTFINQAVTSLNAVSYFTP